MKKELRKKGGRKGSPPIVELIRSPHDKHGEEEAKRVAVREAPTGRQEGRPSLPVREPEEEATETSKEGSLIEGI